LRNAIAKGAISHAYLLTGPKGVGKTSVARILAHEINGIPYSDESTHLDIIEIDAASNRRIDEIRDLREKVHIAPTSSKYKVYIIDEVHMLTREAFNALLKTLEEPPAHVVFILATTESHKVPETIVSRTQRFSFKPIGVDAVVAHLRMIADKEKIKIDNGALNLIAEHGEGSFRDSISMLDQIAGFSLDEISVTDISALLGVPDDSVLNNIISAVNSNDTEALFAGTHQLRENGANPTKTAQQIIKTLRADFVSQNNNLSPDRSIKLMKELLPLTGTNGTLQALEITLLNAVEYEQPVHKVSSPVPKKPVEKVAEVHIEDNVAEIAIEIPNEVIDEPSEVVYETNDDSSSTWNDVLGVLKSKHNTLYGVLRMAETRVESDKITLIFQFEFHKKQLHQTKNLATLRAIVDEKLGKGYEIESEVIKKQSKNAVIEHKTNSDDNLSSVSNIFGGAELLES
jgi:DNA polymerase-3 subunit gamma/tau